MKTARPLKVLHIASGDLWAGAEVQMYTLVTSLQGPGASIAVVLLNHGTLEKKLRHAGVDVVVLDETKFCGFRILLKLIRVVRQKRPDVIHTHRHKENILGSISALVNGNIPTLRTVHGVRKHPRFFDVPQRIINLLNRLTGCFLQKRIISVSEDLASILANEFPVSKIRVIENGVDLDALYRQTGLRDVEKEERPFRVGMVGRLVPVKRVDIFIGTAHYLLEHDSDTSVEFYIIGDGPLRKELESLSVQLGCDNIVHFLGHQENALLHLQDLNALVMTSNHEGLPMVLLEAMALQVPIIAHKIGGIPGLLDQGTCGMLIDSQEPAAYARAIIRLKEDPELRTLMTEKALAMVTDKYSANKNAAACLAEYTSLVNPE